MVSSSLGNQPHALNRKTENRSRACYDPVALKSAKNPQ
ncbi:Uncharacterised protein [Vibrio cholerae]|nr:Uncharacterised protein [Vibrio cholerae]